MEMIRGQERDRVKKYVVRLSGEERAALELAISKGKRAGHLLTRARIVLKADGVGGRGWMERQPNCRGAGHQRPDDRANATATCRGRLRRSSNASAVQFSILSVEFDSCCGVERSAEAGVLDVVDA